MKNSNIIKQINITRIKDNNKVLVKDDIIDEDILKIYLNGDKNFEMVFSMPQPVALTAGFLFTQGIVHKKTDIEKIIFNEQTKQCNVKLNNIALKRLNQFKTRHEIKGSSGGSLLSDKTIDLSSRFDNSKFTDKVSISYNQVISLIGMHRKQSRLFQQTGAVHSAGLCTPLKILSFYEDIGRHNAIDKLAGEILLNSIDTHNKVATLSCRMSLEIIGKIIKTGIPIVISNAAPTLSAVKLAREAGLTMIGFARNNRFNIYTHEKRINANLNNPTSEYLCPEITRLVVNNSLDFIHGQKNTSLSTLSPRENEVLQLIAEGQGTKSIAQKLKISVKTVDNHRANLRKKLGIRSTAQLTKFAITQDLTSLDL